MKRMYWGKRTKRHFTPVLGAKPDISKVLDFLRMRPGPSGEHSVFAFVAEPIYAGSGWWLLRWKDFDPELLPSASTSGEGLADWKPAFHGCKFEALYSIMCHGRLAASCDAAGVYVHKWDTAAKVGNTMRFVDLCRDGVFWASCWYVFVDRADACRSRGWTNGTSASGASASPASTSTAPPTSTCSRGGR